MLAIELIISLESQTPPKLCRLWPVTLTWYICHVHVVLYIIILVILLITVWPLSKWNVLQHFQASDFKGRNFLEFNNRPIVPSYSKGEAWTKHFRHSNANHAPIGEYWHHSWEENMCPEINCLSLETRDPVIVLRVINCWFKKYAICWLSWSQH